MKVDLVFRNQCEELIPFKPASIVNSCQKKKSILWQTLEKKYREPVKFCCLQDQINLSRKKFRIVVTTLELTLP